MEKIILSKYIKGEANQKEREAVIKWIDEDEAHQKEYMHLRKFYDIEVWNMPQKEKKNQNKFYWHRELIKIAAIFIVTFGGLYVLGFRPQSSPEEQTLYVPTGQRAELTLSDGTKVFLNAHSKLIFPSRFIGDKRTVILDGEGYFKVSKNKHKPFFVQTDKYRVKVLGTEFDVFAYRNSGYFSTTLFEGAVDILSNDNKQQMQLRPGWEVVSLNNSTLQKQRIKDPNYSLWKEGIFYMNQESLHDIFKRIELYYDVDIIIENNTLLKNKMSGKFRIKDGVEHILRVLQIKHKFDYKINEERDVITIK